MLHLAPPVPLVFQPAFHQALRWADYTAGRVTFRYKVPIGRSGSRIRVAFRAGDCALELHRATVARGGEVGGKLGSAPVTLTFGGADGVTVRAWERVVSDPVSFPVSAGEELAVSFAAEGGVASSAINAFPDSFVAPGDQTLAPSLERATARHRLAALQTIDVEAPFQRAFVAIGDSITEGYVTGEDDYRRAWPALAQAMSGIPVGNAAVSGQGLWAANEYLSDDVGVLEGRTDCVVLLGTNDLGGISNSALIDRLARLFHTLAADGCRVWAGTLLPKEGTSAGDLALVNAQRAEVNDWLRHRSAAFGVIDFERAVAMPGDRNRFAPGLAQDGIHPSYAGQRVMAELAAQFLAPGPR
ncbi:MAG TPA: GDSL-type esterase/lipase family protein [Myxococcaceae bacterium]|nr:GDSL-type esterase/lipase family protein [Myxococcaceae bacterium]